MPTSDPKTHTEARKRPCERCGEPTGRHGQSGIEPGPWSLPPGHVGVPWLCKGCWCEEVMTRVKFPNPEADRDQ